MKKILLFFVVLVSALSARSQTVYMGGTAGIGYSDMIVEGESYASVVVKNVNVNASIMYRF